jgi:hypothetical protein
MLNQKNDPDHSDDKLIASPTLSALRAYIDAHKWDKTLVKKATEQEPECLPQK